MLPTIDVDDAALSRVVHDARFAPWLETLLDAPVHVAVRSLRPPLTRLEFDAGPGRYEVLVEDAGLPTALRIALALEDTALACDVGTAMLVAMAPAGREPWPGCRLRGIGRDDLPRSGPTLSVGGQHVMVDRVDRAVLADVVRGCEGMPGDGPTFDALRVGGRLRLFTRRWPVATLESLRPGDVVLAGARARAGTLIVGTGCSLRVETEMSFEDDRVTVTGEAGYESEATPDPDTGASPDGIEALELPIAFEIDTARISLAELRAMRPGYVVELATPLAEAAVRLVCHGKTVGEGQLVVIGEHLGVRIARMGIEKP